MSSSELALDHMGLGMRDLDAARAAFTRMGFTLTSRSMHAGALSPGGEVVPWGSGNHCAMFRRGYFELLGLVDETLPSNVKQMVAKYEGLHIVALACDNAEEAYAALTARGVGAAKPATLERDAAFGPHDESNRRARFRNIYLDAERYPEARFIVIQHDTRDVLWQPHLLQHANGVEELHSTYLVASDIDATLARLTPLAGTPVAEQGAYRFNLAHGKLWVLSEAVMRKLSSVSEGRPVHRVAAACFGVASLAHLKAHFDQHSMRYAEGASLDAAQSIWVGPADAAHGTLVFVQTT